MISTIPALIVSVQGVLISIALLRIKSAKGNPYRWLSLFIILLSALVLLPPENDIMFITGISEISTLILYLIGPILYIFIRSLSGFPLDKKKMILLMLPALAVLISFILSYMPFIFNLRQASLYIGLFYEWNWVGAALLEFICIFLSFLHLKKTSELSKKFSAENESLLAGQVSYFLTAYLFLFCIDVLLSLLGYYYENFFRNYTLYMAILNAFLFSLVAYLLISDLERVKKYQKASTSLVKYQRSGITEDEGYAILIKARIFISQEEFYLRNDCTLLSLSEHLAVTVHELSQAVNEGTRENFALFINRYRVEYAKAMLRNSSYDGLSILEIALESGFSSKATFNRVFRSLTKTTPSAYRKMQS